MKKRAVSLILTFLITVSAAAPACAADVQPEEVAPYLSELIDFINENYIGEVDQKKLIEAAMHGIASTLDEYSAYYTDAEYKEVTRGSAKTVYTVDFGFEMNKDGEFNIVEFESGKRRNTDGLCIGDRINSVNGIRTKGLSISEMKGILVSTSPGTMVINITRKGETSDYNVKLRSVEKSTVFYNGFAGNIGLSADGVDKSIGYVKIDTFGEGTAEEFRNTIAALKRDKKTKLILDLRGNTGGYVDQAISICDLIVPSGTIITTKDKAGNVQTYKSTLTKQPFEKTVILVDGLTASASEIIASAMQDSGAGIIVGEQTFGKGVMQSVVEFGDVGTLKLTMFEYFSRNGKKINGVGITPDFEVDDVLFVSEKDKIKSDNVKNALMYLGYDVSSESEIIKSIGKFQTTEGLTPTYKINGETVSKINLRIYEKTKKVDRTLLEGYL
ncbi:MAG: hypothetical protein IJL89_05210, partial [Firmicutes bacterium]|nr:hypothetical protein [Bacillota bacterium]